MNRKPTIIIYRESLAQSIIADVATFGLLLLSIWVSRGSTWWTFATGVMFLFFVIGRAIAFTKSDRCLRFYDLVDVQRWLDRENHEQGENK